MEAFLGTLVDFLKWIAFRPKLSVRIIRDDVGAGKDGLEFEVENQSGTVTSLRPEIRCRFYYLSKLRITKGKNRYFVRESDRHLEPFRPTILHATPEFDFEFQDFSWFRTYKFLPSSGAGTKVRIRNALLEPIGLFRYLWEWVPFRLKGKVRADPHESIDDLERLRRSQGPH